MLLTKIKFFYFFLVLLPFFSVLAKDEASKTADLVIVNADIYSSNINSPRAEAFAIKDGKFIFVGNSNSIDPYIDSSTKVLNLGGVSVLPGFIDSHAHLSAGTAYVNGVDMYGLKNKSDWLKEVEQKSKQIDSKNWIIGGRWDHTLDTSDKLPTKEDLDDLNISRPIALVDIDGHSLWINSAAIELVEEFHGISLALAEGAVVNSDGEFTGILKENARDFVLKHPGYIDATSLRRGAMLNVLNYASSMGITSAHDMSSLEALKLYKSLAISKKMPVRIFYGLVNDCLDQSCGPIFNQLEQEFNVVNEFGPFLDINFIKVYIDGVLSTHTASLIEPYTDKPEESGMLMVSEARLISVVKDNNALGIPIAIHAIGDNAVKVALKAFAEGNSGSTINRIEHAELISADDVKLFHKLGVVASMQPNHGTGVIGKYIHKRVGERESRAYIWNELKESNVALILGSDWPTSPLSPLQQIKDAMFRESPTGLFDGPWYPDQRLLFEDALYAYTIEPARISGQGSLLGSIEIGKFADFVILNNKVDATDIEKFSKLKVSQTYLAGQKVFDHSNHSKLDMISKKFVDFAWGPWLVILLVGSGLFFSIYSKFTPFKYIKRGFRLLFQKNSEEQGSISRYEALAAALSGTIGLGNIAGVALAIKLAGPGAIFWMWVTACIGIATKFFTCSLSVMYRETGKDGALLAGPMYVIKNGLSSRWMFLAYFFAFFGMIGSLPALQSNQMAQIIRDFAFSGGIENAFYFNLMIGLSIATLSGIVIIGGLKRIAKASAWLVPIMGGIYIAAAIIIMLLNFSSVPAAIGSIFIDAFSGSAVIGGTFMGVLIYGIQRGAFSNEAGIGTEALVHGAAKTNNPINQGMVAMIGPIFDTLMVCTATAIVIILSGLWADSSFEGATLTAQAFQKMLGAPGTAIVFLSVLLFGISTIFTYSYYGSSCARFIFGPNSQRIYLYIFIAFIVFFSVISLESAINIIDGSFAMMAIPTLISSLVLAPKVMQKVKEVLA